MNQTAALYEFLTQARAGELPDVYQAEPVFASRMAAQSVENPAIVVDISYYQKPILASTFQRIGGDYVIVKSTMRDGTDKMLDTHVANLEAAGIPYGYYHWFDPTGTAAQQLRLLEAAVNKHHPTSIWIDIEQAWSNWSAYWEYLGKKITWAQVPKFSPSSLFDKARAFMQAACLMFPDTPLGIYTGKWFIDSYCQKLPIIMPIYNTWLAQYNNAYRGIADDQRVIEIVSDAMTRSPVLPNGVTEYSLWQITSGIVIPGLVGNAPIDFNISSMSQDEFMDMVGGEAMPDPEPYPGWAVRVNMTALPWLNIRESASKTSAKVGMLFPGAVVRVTQDYYGWLRLADGRGWISGLYTKTV